MFKSRPGSGSGGWKGGNKSFGAKKPWDRGGFGGGRDTDVRMMHPAVCGDCGSHCEVPFKPNGRKPVLCSNCFKKDGDDSRPSFGEKRSYDRPSFDRAPSRSFDRPTGGADVSGLKDQLQRIEMKLDEVLASLSLKI